MKLYHISLFEDSKIKVFTPRIPDEFIRLDDEDGFTERICLSDSIDGCISAIWCGGETLYSKFYQNYSDFIRVYEFDTLDIKEGNLITPQILYRTDKVRDAEVTREHWVINQNLKPRESYVISITDYEEEYKDNISYENLRLCKENDLDINDYIEGYFTKININSYKKYNENDILNDEEFLFEVDSKETEKNIKCFFEDYLGLYDSEYNISNSKNLLRIKFEDYISIAKTELNKKGLKVVKNNG